MSLGIPSGRQILTRRGAIAGLAACGLTPAAACGQASDPTEYPLDAAPLPSLGARPGLDQGLLDAAMARAAQLPQLRSLIVARDGEVALERAVRGPGLDQPVNIKSAAKTVLAAIAGAALDRGVLTGLDQPIGPLLGRRIPAGADPRVKAITVEQLLSMAAGLEPTSGPNYGRWVSSRDWVAYALSRPFVAQPGGPMLYSTGTSHILSALLSAASGKTTLQLARDWLGAPLGVEIPPWPRDPQGVYFGGNDMLMSPRALLALGEMFRNRGVAQGRRVLSEAFVADAWRSRGGRSPYTGYAYGLGWWLREAGAHRVNFAWGYGGQMVFVAPSLNLTVVMTSDPTARGATGHVQALHALVDETLIPAAERGGSA